MEAVCSSETLVYNKNTTRLNNSEYHLCYIAMKTSNPTKICMIQAQIPMRSRRAGSAVVRLSFVWKDRSQGMASIPVDIRTLCLRNFVDALLLIWTCSASNEITCMKIVSRGSSASWLVTGWTTGRYPGRSVRHTIHIRLIPKLRKRGVIPSLPIRLHGVVLKVIGTTLAFIWHDLYRSHFMK
jgi:hypothetical protein